jgi:hypothetical protein
MPAVEPGGSGNLLPPSPPTEKAARAYQEVLPNLGLLFSIGHVCNRKIPEKIRYLFAG